MTYLLSVFLLFLNRLFSYFKKNVKVLAFVLLIFMWILYWSNTTNPDYYNYLQHYTSMQHGSRIFDGSGREFGYRILMKIAISLGIDFKTYLAIIVALSYTLIHNTVKKFSYNYNYVYSLYFLYPFFLDVVQVRNFIAMSILIYSVRYLVEDSVTSRIFYIFLILIASSIHYSALLYLPMVLIRTTKKNNLILGIVVVSLIGSLIVLINNKQVPFINQFIVLFIDSEKVLNWMDEKTNYGFILFWAMQTFSFIMSYYAKKMIKYFDIDKNDDEKILYIRIIYWVNLLAFIYFPLYLLASTYTRIMRNIMLLNYISLSIVQSRLSKGNKRMLFNSIVLIYVLFFFIVDLYLPYKDVIIYEVLNQNLFTRR